MLVTNYFSYLTSKFIKNLYIYYFLIEYLLLIILLDLPIKTKFIYNITEILNY